MRVNDVRSFDFGLGETADMLRESVRGLLGLDFDTILVGDGAPILQNAKERLKELVGTFPQ